MIAINFLDIRTLSFMTLFFSLIYGVGLILYAVENTRFQGIKTIAFGFLSLSLGTFLFSLRQYIDDYSTVIFANSFIFLSLILIYRGLIKFCQLTVGKEKHISLFLLGIMLISFYYYTFIDLQINVRVIIFSFCALLQTFLCARALLSNNNKVHQSKTKIMGFFFFALGLFHLFRMTFMISEPYITNFMTAGIIHSLTLISFQITVCFISFFLIWMANAILEGELKEQARIDPLTGVNNRRSLDELASLELSRSIRNEHDLSIIMCDIDNFKQFNDTHGHLIGDDILINVASILANNVRKNDVVCRYGGEEFLILLPETNAEQTTKLAEKMRVMINQDKSIISNDEPLSVTLSFGVASYQANIINWHTIAKSADVALYQAKNTGKNKVVAENIINEYL